MRTRFNFTEKKIQMIMDALWVYSEQIYEAEEAISENQFSNTAINRLLNREYAEVRDLYSRLRESEIEETQE